MRDTLHYMSENFDPIDQHRPLCEKTYQKQTEQIKKNNDAILRYNLHDRL